MIFVSGDVRMRGRPHLGSRRNLAVLEEREGAVLVRSSASLAGQDEDVEVAHGVVMAELLLELDVLGLTGWADESIHVRSPWLMWLIRYPGEQITL